MHHVGPGLVSRATHYTIALCQCTVDGALLASNFHVRRLKASHEADHSPTKR